MNVTAALAAVWLVWTRTRRYWPVIRELIDGMKDAKLPGAEKRGAVLFELKKIEEVQALGLPDALWDTAIQLVFAAEFRLQEWRKKDTGTR